MGTFKETGAKALKGRIFYRTARGSKRGFHLVALEWFTLGHAFHGNLFLFFGLPNTVLIEEPVTKRLKGGILERTARGSIGFFLRRALQWFTLGFAFDDEGFFCFIVIDDAYRFGRKIQPLRQAALGR